MSSTAQIEANRTNAQLSTGPRTLEGKAASAANATKLGLYAKQAVLLTPQDYTEYEALESAYAYELRPYTPVEKTLFSQVVLAAWNIQRANRLEAALAVDGIDPLLSDANEKTLNRIATYRMRAERTFHKSRRELQAYRSAHPLDESMLKNEAKVETKNEPKLLQFAFKREPYVRPEPKIGRNELCPCHSGRKHKNCCLRNEPKSTIPAARAAQGSEI